MAKLFAGNKFKLLAWTPAVAVLAAILGFGAVAVAQSGQFTSPTKNEKQEEVPGMLLTGSPTPTKNPTDSPSSSSTENPDQTSGGDLHRWMPSLRNF